MRIGSLQRPKAWASISLDDTSPGIERKRLPIASEAIGRGLSVGGKPLRPDGGSPVCLDIGHFVCLAARTAFTSGNISSHMTKLEDAGYVEVTKTFVNKRPRTTYRLTETGRHAFEQYRTSIEGLFHTPD